MPAPARPSDAEQRRQTWANAWAILTEVFDVPAVLRGDKPVSQLKGASSILAVLVLQVINMASSNFSIRLSRETSEYLYMRNVPMFRVTILKSVAMNLLTNTLYFSMRGVLQSRMILAWREHLMHRIHHDYFDTRRMTFIRQFHLPEGRSVPDPDDRKYMHSPQLAFQG